jgi:hypothetical protein
MTQDEVLKELRSVIADNQHFTTWTVSTPHLVELVNRAVLREREACAKLCAEDGAQAMDFTYSSTLVGGYFAEIIRARGNA